MNTEKRDTTHLTVCGIRFFWLAPGQWEYEDINARSSHGISITLMDTFNVLGGCIAGVSVWGIGDRARIREATVRVKARSRRAALIEAIDLLDYPLKVCGFQKLGKKS